MGLSRRQFTKEFKLAAVRWLEQGVSGEPRPVIRWTGRPGFASPPSLSLDCGPARLPAPPAARRVLMASC